MMNRMRLILSAGVYFIAFLPMLSAQVLLSEGFENGWPEGYTLINVDGLEPDDPDLIGLLDSAWSIRYITQAGVNSNTAFSVSWYVGDQGPSDDWMILPALDLGENTVLSWTGMAITSSGDFRDRYQVAISTGGPEIEDFEENPLLFDTGNTGEEITPQERSVNLADAGYANQTVYIAFRNFTAPFDPGLPSGPGNGGNELMIDDILVENLMVDVRERLQTLEGMQVWPNPVEGLAHIQAELAEGGQVVCSIQDIFGRAIRQETKGYFAPGPHNWTLSTENLPAGIYLITIQTGTQAGTTRIIK